MMDWWNGLPVAGQIFTMIAVPATVVMILQTVLLFFGLGSGGDSDVDASGLDMDLDADTDLDFDGDFDGVQDVHAMANMEAGGEGHSDGLSLFSIRGIVGFFSVGGWAGLLATVSGLDGVSSAVLSVVAGFAALVGIAWLMKNALKLQDSGNLDLRTLIDKQGTVYLTIPPQGTGRGKVTVQVASGLLELEAISSQELSIPTGSQVEICAITEDNAVVVRALDIESRNSRGGISKWS